MSSEAYRSFLEAKGDVDNLKWFHEESGGTSPGKRPKYFESLNKSAIVLLCAAFETYIESVICECVARNAKRAKTPEHLLKPLLQMIAAHLRKGADDRTWISASGEGWRAMAVEVAKAKVLALNTPKVAKISQLMETVLDVKAIETDWLWRKNPVGTPAKALDDFVTLRGAIAHGEKLETTVTKAKVTTSEDLITRIVDIIEERLKAEKLIK